MKTSTKLVLGATVILLAAAFGFVLSLYLTKPTIITNPIPVYIEGRDSVIVKHQYHIIYDTTKAEVKNDTATTLVYKEQVFERDTIKSKTDIKYIIPDSTFVVSQSFDYIKTKEVRVDTVKLTIPYETVIERDIPFYKEPYFNFITGVLATLVLFFLTGG